MHYMSVKQKGFDLLKSGQKTVEMCLFDLEKQKIKMGDYILFLNQENQKETFEGKVVNLYWDKNFDLLAKRLNPLSAGFQTRDDLLMNLKKDYSLKEQEAYGVVGIEINRQ